MGFIFESKGQKERKKKRRVFLVRCRKRPSDGCCGVLTDEIILVFWERVDLSEGIECVEGIYKEKKIELLLLLLLLLLLYKLAL